MIAVSPKNGGTNFLVIDIKDRPQPPSTKNQANTDDVSLLLPPLEIFISFVARQHRARWMQTLVHGIVLGLFRRGKR